MIAAAVRMATWAARSVEHLGCVITPLEGKRPFRERWNDDCNLIWCPEEAYAYFSQHPGHNFGACLEPSRLVSVDADHPEATRVLAAEGIHLNELIETVPTIVGRNPRLEFRAPDMPLSRKSIAWPPQVLGQKPSTIVEFRAGRVQDVLPPSQHPNTKRPYYWKTPPKNGFPPLPDELLALWLDFEAFRERALKLCPWPDPRPARAAPAPRRATPYTGPSVISQFNATHDVVALLESHGYTPAGKRRWRSPDGHGVAGVVLLPSGKVYCHHTSDPLGDERSHDAFDLFVAFEHNGDHRAAVKAAAQLLGIQQQRGTHGR